jgi:hypothetical protein
MLPLLLTGISLAGCGGGHEAVRSSPPPTHARDWAMVAPANPAASNAVL